MTISGATLAGLAPPAADQEPAVAARQLEAFFVRHLLAQSRSKEAGLLDGGFAGDTFRDMLDNAIADTVADAGGLGLAAGFEDAMGGAPGLTAVAPPRPTLVDHLDQARALAVDGAMVRPAPGRFSSGFGPRANPMGSGHGFHTGLDIAARLGTPVVAAAGGEVVHAGPAGSYGNLITVRHPDGTETRYGHLSAVNVEVGDRVTAGAAIGAVGSTGRSTGPHLHFEVRRDGKAVDPRPYLDASPGPGSTDGDSHPNSPPHPSPGHPDGRPTPVEAAPMRIDPTALTAIHEPRTREASSGPRPAGDQASVVSLGAAANASQAGGLDPAITARIGRIRELLASGEYQVNLDQLAERILDDDAARAEPKP